MRLRLTDEGLIEGIRYVASPNCDERPTGCAIDLLVIHHISLPPGAFGGPGIVELFTNRLDPAAHPDYASLAELRVSSHFLIRRDGRLIQFVPCAKRAWHAGASSWKGRTRCNDFSIGIEMEGTGEVAFTDAQFARLAELTRALKARYPITDIVGHSDVAPGRKSDPGPFFDWARYLRTVTGDRGPVNGRNRKAGQKRQRGATRKRPVTGHRSRVTVSRTAKTSGRPRKVTANQ